MILSEKDIKVLEQIFNVVLYAFGGDKFEKQLGTGSLSLLKKAMGEVTTTCRMTVKQAEEMAMYFATARIIIDPIEFHTLTGFTWEEGSELYERIKEASLN